MKILVNDVELSKGSVIKIILDNGEVLEINDGSSKGGERLFIEKKKPADNRLFIHIQNHNEIEVW